MFWTMDKVMRILFWGGLSCFLAGILSLVTQSAFWFIFIVIWITFACIHTFLGVAKVSATDKAVLVTGCDSGFGHALALRLVDSGFRVFACCLKADSGGEGAAALRRVGSPRLHVLQVDITQQEQVDKAGREVEELLPPGGEVHGNFVILSVVLVLWAVVNNAGISTFGAAEWTPLEIFKEVLDVNVLGHIRVTKAFLPLLRKSRGRLVNITSAEGRWSYPIVSAYIMAKHAMEAFSDCLRNEVSRFGIHVCLVEPGNYTAGTMLNTIDSARLQGEKLWSSMTEEVREAYGKKYFDNVISSREMITGTGLHDLTTVVDTMVEALTQRFPHPRYTCMDFSLFLRMQVAQHLPERFYDFLYVDEEQKAFYS